MRESFEAGLAQASALFMTFVPKLLLAAVVIVAAYFVAKLISRLLSGLLEKAGFNRLVERGGVKRALDKSGWEASRIVSQTVFYFVILFGLQFAFGLFGPNPVSDILTRIIAFLPNVLVAMIIVILSAAIASGAKQLINVALGNLSYGRFIANAAAVALLFIGISAALNQVGIAPAIVNGLFYAVLAAVVGVTIVAVGGGGILPMRQRWEKALSKMAEEAPKIHPSAQAATLDEWEHERMKDPQGGGTDDGKWTEDQRDGGSEPGRRRRPPPRE